MAQEIPSQYDPTTVEDRWTQAWEDAQAFRSVPDEREPYTVVIPPTQRDRCVAHGAHAQQHHSGRPGAPGPDAGQERVLGARDRPRLDRHGSQGGAQAARPRNQKV